MYIKTSWQTLKIEEPTVVAIGNFDGVHIGHQALIRKAVNLARELNATPVVLTFDPHPLKVFRIKDKEHLCLTPLKEKAKLLRLYGANKVIVLEFTSSLYELSPEDFVKEVLLKRLNAKGVVVGENFKFGKGRSGDVKLLSELAERFDFVFYPHDAVLVDGIPVSSTRIRRLLRQGKIRKTSLLLGRPYKITGRVVEGKKRGKTIGFPTANLKPENEVIPQNGVYLTATEIGNRLHKSLTNIGNNPTF